jgi:hypothetical protein
VYWRYLDASGSEVGRSDRFEGRSAAEEWLAGSWSGLEDLGAEEVELVDEGSGRPVYRMGLRDV